MRCMETYVYFPLNETSENTNGGVLLQEFMLGFLGLVKCLNILYLLRTALILQCLFGCFASKLLLCVAAFWLNCTGEFDVLWWRQTGFCGSYGNVSAILGEFWRQYDWSVCSHLTEMWTRLVAFCGRSLLGCEWLDVLCVV